MERYVVVILSVLSAASVFLFKSARLMSLSSLWRLAGVSSLCGVLFVSAALYAEVGDDCTDGDALCGLAEVCVPDGQGEGTRLCTRRCDAVQPCPEGFECTRSGSLSVCLPPPLRVRLGEGCDELPCQEGLLCVNINDQMTCTQPCAQQGACPVGFECRLAGQEEGLCVEGGPLAQLGEPCDERGCVEGATCLPPEGERALPYCTLPCDLPCPFGLSCEGGGAQGEGAHCRHNPPPPRAPGARCPLSFADAVAASCGEGLICEPSEGYELMSFEFKGQGWCAQPCDLNTPCPEGYGCVIAQGRSAETSEGLCAEGQPTAPIFTSFSEEEPMGGLEPPLFGGIEDGSTLPQGSEGSGGAQGGSCEAGLTERAHLWGALLIFTLLLGARPLRRTSAHASSPRGALSAAKGA